MQIQENSRRNQRIPIIEKNYRFFPVIFVMLCMMFFISALANGQDMDFGDAPDPRYPTLLASDGARHEVKPGIFLGSGVDADPEGQHTLGATGDDHDGNDDEDGVILPASLTPGNTANVSVTASTTGYLNAWIDFNGDGDWSDPGEQIFSDRSLSSGANNPFFGVPEDAVSGATYTRFRFTSYPGGGMPPVGAQDDGEVEDYMVTIAETGGDDPPEIEMDFGDAPEPYPTTLAANGARHRLNPDVYLGLILDGELDGQPDPGAQGDDNNGNDDEDGVNFISLVTPGSTATVNLVASTGGRLNAWIDFNDNGSWAEPEDQIFGEQILHPGSNNLNFNVPQGAVPGITYSRFRFSLSGDISYDGEADDGEVEDHQVEIGEQHEPMEMDFGDAQVPPFPTLLEDDGARHVVNPDIYLGFSVDAETNGHPDPGAQGDDSDGSDDEDGVAFTPPLMQGSPVIFAVTASTPGFLNAWIDFNANGNWGESDEHIAIDMPLSAGVNNVPVNIPTDASPEPIFARFRFSTQSGLSYAGPAEDGEVEDYLLEIAEAAPGIDIEKSINGEDADEPPGPTIRVGDPLSWTYVVTNTGSVPLMSVRVEDSAGVTVSCPKDTLEVGESMTCTADGIVTEGQHVNIGIAVGVTESGSETMDEDPCHYFGERPVDYGDAPDSYRTLLASNGARHFIDPDVFLGTELDAEADGQPDAGAAGDDLNGDDDEDGVTFTSALMQGITATVTVIASTGGILNAWMDFDGSGDWNMEGEHIFPDQPLAPGPNMLSFNIPMSAATGPTFARFRFSHQHGLLFDDEAENGEVEDYTVEIDEANLDFGDAPDPTYPTLLASNGARHVIVSGVYLGNEVDADANGQPDSNSWGDDNDGNDDEDGIGWSWSFAPGENATLNSVASVDGYLNAWIDFNNDGDWADPGEQILMDEPLAAGINSSNFSVPVSAKIGLAFGRFRFSTQAGLSYDGLAEDGEVEDHQVSIDDLDYGDAPSPYPTLRADNGARHIADSGYHLGNTIDSESDGLPDTIAMGDDNDGNDDEDGVVFTSALTPGSTATVSVDNSLMISGTLMLNAWIDFNRDGDWADAGEQIFTDQPLLFSSTHSLSFSVPAGASPGLTFARFRSGEETGISFDGLAHNGEVEDYQVEIRQLFDYGDAPDPTYPTLLASDGARHVIDPDVYLGSGVDAELDGQPDSGAQGDDNNGTDDEDGIPLTSSLTQGTTNTFAVNASTNGLLNAWIDFNIDGDWDEPDEQIFTDHALAAGVNSLNIAIPVSATPGTTFARFRFSTQGGLSFIGEADDGEVEDYTVEIDELVELDFGDAQDPTYPTLLASNGARHIIKSGVYLGTSVDAESNGQPHPSAIGDDNDGNDDDDGVLWNWLLPGNTAPVFVTASIDGYLNAWIDLNFDGDWADPNEQIFTDEPLLAGINTLGISLPLSATVGNTVARFRFSTAAGLSYDGPAPDGEVEDRMMAIMEGDYGDAPSPYPTLLANDGARHVARSGFHLGSSIDGELDGQPNASGMGDDNDGNDDEDGVVFTSSLVPESMATVDVTADISITGAIGYLNAWIDFNGNGDWSDPGEQIFTDELLAHGVNSLSYSVPAGASPGTTFARFRLGESGASFTGIYFDGEVEDYQVEIKGMDFGDAPDPTYPTLLASDGARHVMDPDIFLGFSIDVEPNGQPDAGAQGDDNNGSDDEDGVTITSPLVQGSVVNVNVTASVDGLLNAWMDFDIDGDWTQSDDQIFIDQALVAGVNALTINIPANARPGATFARFRFDTAGGLSYNGRADNGEVEDYTVEIREKVELLDFGDAPDPTYPTLLASNGARHVIVSGVYLGNEVDADANGQPDSNSWGDDNDGNDDEDGIGWSWSFAPGESATLNSVASVDGYLNAWIDFNNDGDWADAGEQILTDEPLTAGINASNFNVPANAAIGLAFGRFRFSTQTGLSYDGLAEDGEVEDHQVSIDDLDYGDAPSPYPTLKADNGARHIADSGYHLGNIIDSESDGLPDSSALGDDNDGSDDEDGVVFTSALTPGSTATVSVDNSMMISGTLMLNAWIDFNRDGDWADAGEQIFTDRPLLFSSTHSLSFSVPAGTSPGLTFARFRSGEETGISFDGLAHNGEVEDSQVEIKELTTMDFGDAPSPYPTLLADNGARHTVVTRIYLGSSVDAENDGQPDVGAQGDDNNGADDEDGVVFKSPLIPGDKPTVDVTVPVDGYLNAWVDFNIDGDWADTGEQIFKDETISFGTTAMIFNVPAGAKSGSSYARFRFNTTGGLSYDGLADNGDVEDYTVEIKEPRIDFGDAPDSYNTTLARSGARHIIVTGVYMGTNIDLETDGQPDAGAQGDDNDGNDDEDGVAFTSRLLPGALASLDVTVSVDGLLTGLIDFNRDGDWDVPDEYVFTAQMVTGGVNTLAIKVPSQAATGATIARFRFVTSGVISYDGQADNGEVEDYTVEIEDPGDLDFGDAPSPYPTMLAEDGARHVVTAGAYLGSSVDADVDGQPDPDALGDDNDSSDDDDGVVFTSALVKGNAAQIAVTASALGRLDAWMDFNADGDWADTGEQIFSSEFLNSGLNNLKFDVPIDAIPGLTYARFRFTVTPFDTSYDGLSHDGEVEDYQVEIGETGTVAVWPGDNNNDGLVDGRDVLPVGIYWNSTGPSRSFASSNWEMQLAMPWDPEAATYADANGDGIVDARDILPIGLNWQKVHSVPAAGPAKLAISVDHSRHILAYEQILEALESLPDTGPVVEMKTLMRDVISIAKHQAIPEKTSVFQNYPNPFNPETWIPFQLTEDAQVNVTIYNSAGALIRTLDLGHKDAGTYVDREYAAYWDGRSDDGDEAASGIYFYGIQAGEFSAVRKMILVR